MKEVRKKSADSAVNQMLIKAHRKSVELAWDRAEAMQPQCGFGRMAICCNDCQEGPCRVNPFATEEQHTICGRDQHDLVVNDFLQSVGDGSAALVKLALEFGADLEKNTMAKVMTVKDTMMAIDTVDRLVTFGKSAAIALQAISQAKVDVYGTTAVNETAVNMGVLRSDQINILIHGHVAPKVTKEVIAAAIETAKPVNVVAMCGNEVSGALNLPVVTNYDSQETPLLTGAVDLLVLGSQCVMPAIVSLAQKLDIPVVYANVVNGLADMTEAVDLAVKAFNRRAGRHADIPENKTYMTVGYTAANSVKLFEALSQGYHQGLVQGLVYVGGCGNIGVTQDKDVTAMAADLISQGYMVVSAGCAGISLAKAGLCNEDYQMTHEGLKKVLPPGTPPVLNIGACHDAGEFLEIVKIVGESGIPVFAIFPELAHNKTLATAVAFATSGIKTFVGIESVWSDSQMATLLGETMMAKSGGQLLPLSDFKQIPKIFAEVAATK